MMDAEVKEAFEGVNKKLNLLFEGQHKLLTAMTGDPFAKPPVPGIMPTQLAINKDLYGDADHNRKGIIKDIAENTDDISELKKTKREIVLLGTFVGGIIALGWRTFIDWLTSHPKP